MIIIIILLTIGTYLFLQNQKVNNSSITLENNQERVKVKGFSGNVLAGITSPFIEFNKQDYDKALASGELILLDFYATWCPICRAEEPEIFAGFNQLNNENVVGFRVNFNDPDTDSDEKNLATQFAVPYQHTKIILKNGKEVARYTDQWIKQDLIDAINQNK